MRPEKYKHLPLLETNMLKKFLFKRKEIQRLQQKVWRGEILIKATQKFIGEAKVVIERLDSRIEIDKDLIKEIEDSGNAHKYENRKKIEKAMDEIKSFEEKKKFQLKEIEKSKRNIEGVTQMNTDTERLIRIIKEEF